MKSRLKFFFLVILFCLVISPIVNAQDIIFLRTGEEVQAKIIEVGIQEIRYKKFKNKGDLPVYVISKSDIFMIKYEEGTKEVFKENTGSDEPIVKEEGTEIDMCVKGKKDAFIYFNRGFGAGLVSTLIFVPVGFIVSAALGASDPKVEKLNAPDMKLIRNREYKACYTKEAKRIRRGKVWNGFWLGLGINVVAWIVFFPQ